MDFVVTRRSTRYRAVKPWTSIVAMLPDASLEIRGDADIEDAAKARKDVDHVRTHWIR
jgi:hypothetical protein